MKRAYRYKIKPTAKQQNMLLQFFGCARFIYNWGLARKIKAYNETKKNINYVQLARELTQLKQTDDHQWLNDCAIEVLQQSLRSLETAYANFFRSKKGFPKFKSKKHAKEVCKFINRVHFDFIKSKVKIPKVGWMRLCPNQEFDLSKCKIGTLTVSRDRCGEYWCSIVVEDGLSSKPKAKVCDETAVGIILGQNGVILSDGSKYDAPAFLIKGEKKLRRLQKKFARTELKSKRHEAMRIKFAKQHRKIANRRADFLHNVTSEMVGRFDTVCLEKAGMSEMGKNLQPARNVSSLAWGEFIRQLTYKCERGGKNLVIVERPETTRVIADDGARSLAMKIKQWGLQQQAATG